MSPSPTSRCPAALKQRSVVIDAPPPSRQEVRESEQQAREMIRQADQVGKETDIGQLSTGLQT